MQLKKIMAFLLLLPLVALAKPAITEEPKITEASYAIQADYFANLYGVDSKIVNKVLECESQFKPNAKGDGGRSKGIAQFQKPTWDRMEAEYFKEWGEHLDYASSHDQIKLTSYAISKGWGNNWTSYVAIKKGGKYSFYSNQLKKHFVVYCKL